MNTGIPAGRSGLVWSRTMGAVTFGVLCCWLTAARATSYIQQSAELIAVRLRNDGSPEPDGADCTDVPCTWILHIDCEGRIESMYGTMLQGVAVDVELIPEGPP